MRIICGNIAYVLIEKAIVKSFRVTTQRNVHEEVDK